jgi:hypothetical protein
MPGAYSVRRSEGLPPDVGDVRRQGGFAEGFGGGDPVVAVGDVVAAVLPVDLEGRQCIAVSHGDGDLLESPSAALVGGEEVAVELAGGAVRAADDVVEADQLFGGVARPEKAYAIGLIQAEGG